MLKLYSGKENQEVEIGRLVNQGSEGPDVVTMEEVPSGLYGLELITEHFSDVSSKLQTTEVIRKNLNGRKLGSLEYFITLESYTPILEAIAINMGVKLHVASLEDFSNEYSSKAAHCVAMEGIGDFIKNLWNKLKDVMSKFFRKVREFVRRLVNANMEIDSYEKYVPALISKIKSDKLKLLDNTPTIESKLPALLAFDGMDRIDSDFMLTNGLRSLDALTEAVNNQVRVGLKQISSIDLVEFRKIIEEIVDSDFSNPNIGEILSSGSKNLDIKIIQMCKTLLPVPYNINDLPEDAYESISTSAVNSKTSELNVYGLTDHLDTYTVLPNGFNAFVAIDLSSKIYATTITSKDQNVDNRINALGSVETVSKLYEFYKKFTKLINIKELDAIIGNTEKEIDTTIKLMASKYVLLLEKLSRMDVGGITNEHKFNAYLNTFFEKWKDFSGLNRDISHIDSRLYYAIQNDDIMQAMEIVLSKNAPDKILEVFGKICKKLNITSDYEKNLAAISPNVNATVKEEVKKDLDDKQKYILSFFHAIQVLLRGLSGSLIATYTECRYELIRYIYQSAKRYG